VALEGGLDFRRKESRIRKGAGGGHLPDETGIKERRMTRNFLVFIFGLIILLLFSFAFAYVSIYSEILIAGILALVGFVVVLAIAIMIGITSRDEGGALYVWFFTIAMVTGILFVWYLTRAGTLLKVW
jgi:FtsH-binding integral membrane protein